MKNSLLTLSLLFSFCLFGQQQKTYKVSYDNDDKGNYIPSNLNSDRPYIVFEKDNNNNANNIKFFDKNHRLVFGAEGFVDTDINRTKLKDINWTGKFETFDKNGNLLRVHIFPSFDWTNNEDLVDFSNSKSTFEIEGLWSISLYNDIKFNAIILFDPNTLRYYFTSLNKQYSGHYGTNSSTEPQRYLGSITQLAGSKFYLNFHKYQFYKSRSELIWWEVAAGQEILECCVHTFSTFPEYKGLDNYGRKKFASVGFESYKKDKDLLLSKISNQLLILEDDINNSFKKIQLENDSRKNIKTGIWTGNGSGIILSKSGYIVTNNHVIDDANEIEVELILNDEIQKFNAEVIQKDLRNDLAILKIVDEKFDGFSTINYNFKTRSSDVGTKIYTFGYPKALSGMGKEIKVTEGIISSKSGVMGDITTYQITAPIQGGNSGGPLFDDKGNLVGINSSRFKSDETENVNYSIKSSYVLNLIDVLPKSIDLPSSTKLQSLPITEQIKEISKYVVLIKVK